MAFDRVGFEIWGIWYWKPQSWRCFNLPFCGTDSANGADACAPPPPCDCGFAARRRLGSGLGHPALGNLFRGILPRRSGSKTQPGQSLRFEGDYVFELCLFRLSLFFAPPCPLLLACAVAAGPAKAGPRLTGIANRSVICKPGTIVVGYSDSSFVPIGPLPCPTPRMPSRHRGRQGGDRPWIAVRYALGCARTVGAVFAVPPGRGSSSSSVQAHSTGGFRQTEFHWTVHWLTQKNATDQKPSQNLG